MPRHVSVRLAELRTMEYALAKLLDRLERREHKFRNFDGYRGTVLHAQDLRRAIAYQIGRQEKSNGKESAA